MKKILLAIAMLALPCMQAKSDYIVVDKPALSLTLYNDSGQVRKKYKVAVGKNYGQKLRKGDCKTPEGTFKVQSIENSTRWDKTHSDYKGPQPGPYGPRFIRLSVPFANGIGIHGTRHPETIGTRHSEGCIRMYNADVLELSRLVKPGMKVIVRPDTQTTYIAPKKAVSRHYKAKKAKKSRRHSNRHSPRGVAKASSR